MNLHPTVEVSAPTLPSRARVAWTAPAPAKTIVATPLAAALAQPNGLREQQDEPVLKPASAVCFCCAVQRRHGRASWRWSHCNGQGESFSPPGPPSLYSFGMIPGRHAPLLASMAFVASLSSAVVRAEAGPESPADATTAAPENAADNAPAAREPAVKENARQDQSAGPARSTPVLTAPFCPQPRIPAYVVDWDRLASLTELDFRVGPKAEFWARRNQVARWIAASGIILGGGAAALGTIDRLTHDSWTDSSKWSIAGGLTLTAFSVFAAWAFAPDRDDLITTINEWNLRHPDRPLAP